MQRPTDQHPHLWTLWEVTVNVEFPRLLLSKSINIWSGSAPRLCSGERLLSDEWLTLIAALLRSRRHLKSLFELPLTPNCEETGGWLRHRGIYFISSACTVVETRLQGEQTAPVSDCDLCSHVRAGGLPTSPSTVSNPLHDQLPSTVFFLLVLRNVLSHFISWLESLVEVVFTTVHLNTSKIIT